MNKAVLYFITFVFCNLFINQNFLQAQKPAKPVPPLYYDKGKLIYTPDELGNRIPDFSYCGYKASEQPIPEVRIKIRVPVTKADATLRIQSAIDYVATLTPDANGFRGAVLLERGVYKINSSLVIETSGVVIRGSGINETIIENTAVSRTPVIIFKGGNFNIGPTIFATITDSLVPANAASLHIDYSAVNISEYPNVEIIRPSTTEWIKAVGCSGFGGGISALGWKDGDANLVWHRKLKSVEGNKITLDAPITSDIDAKFGVAKINFYHTDARIQNCGIENLTLQSVYNKLNVKDEDHCWDAVQFSNTQHCWVRQIDFKNFAGSGVFINNTAQNITVQDCRYLQPVSEKGGGRRNAFISEGQQILFQRCYTENAMHSFSVANTAAGPNAFVQCESINSFNYSGAINNWCSGTLFDIVTIDGNAIRFDFRGQDGNGAGWAGVNSVLWNCSASLAAVSKPPTANNYAFGTWAQFNGDGYWLESNNTVNPRSLFYTQLKERTGKDLQSKNIMPFDGEASSSPTVEVAQQLTKEADRPRMQLKEWIENAAKRNQLNTSVNGIVTIDAIGVKKLTTPVAAPTLQIKNGWLVRGDVLQTGKRTSVQWWSGGLQPKDIQQAKPHITRFVPGRTGKGLTDDLNEVVTEMKTTNTIAIEHNYGLWYDRRRDDHQRVRRMDGDVWPPFYELPFARSGIGTAWDGLSKYDLTKYNKFYWNRLKQFADLADQNGLLLVHQNYFQHNIIEAGAHYADFPWRTANNINNTGFTEPVNYAGDKRIFYAEQFYDLSNPVRKELHKKYIRQCLNNFKDNNGVIQLISEEYTGPLHFVKFWLDVIREWEKETGKHPLIGLSVTKDVQDSVLAMPAYAALVDVIDIRYWHYQADGTVYAPRGGQNLAPRQHARLLKPRKTNFEQVYRVVKEYKEKFPNKAVVYSGDSYPEFGMAAFMAGGSLPVLPADMDKEILRAAATMKPAATANGEYVLTDGKKKIVYNNNTKKLTIQ